MRQAYADKGICQWDPFRFLVARPSSIVKSGPADGGSHDGRRTKKVTRLFLCLRAVAKKGIEAGSVDVMTRMCRD
jgi:hypothetical protein